MLRYLQIAVTLVGFTICASAIAFPQNTAAAENAKSDVRNRGSEVSGLALSIGVDKTTYVVGDDIPLHVAFWNIRASNTVGLPSCKWVTLTVRNEKGEKFDQRDGDLSCNFSGPCPSPLIISGDIVTSEQNLTDYRLPPGTYTVAGEWTTSAYLKDPKLPPCFGPRGTQLFQVHSNPVTIRVVATKQP